MRFRARVEVRLKEGYLDPEGMTVKRALRDLGYQVGEARTAKIYEFSLEADSLEDAKKQVREICKKLLSNPVKDDYLFQVEEIRKMENKGIEPLAVKLLAGMILLAVGLGIGLTMYRKAGKTLERLNIQLSLEPDSWTLPRPENENSLEVQVTVEPLLDFHGQVSLSAEGEPAGVSLSFSRTSGTPPFYSILTITVSSTVNRGSYSITVKAEGEGVLASKAFTLRIT
jgi:phosphoribosylformylglycinamidine synthase